MKKRALVAMSGGVDSSAAACLMMEAGWEIIGCTMHLVGETWDQDAARTAEKLGIPLHVFDYRELFREKVMEPFVRAYEAGRTPNPCIACNKYLKFGVLYEQADALGAEVLVTGHYARIRRDQVSGLYRLCKAEELARDQSYVLYDLSQEQLARTMFPLGTLTKAQARSIAQEAGLVNAGRRDSQDICFCPDGDYAGFICRYTGREYPHGDFVDEEGHVLGEHRGIIRYTKGQRKGLGLALPRPMYVKEKDVSGNRVVLCTDEKLFERTCRAEEFHWISGRVPSGPLRVRARIRYNQREVPATAEGVGPDGVRVEFDEPVRAVTAGQSLVLYDGESVLGGGILVS